DGQCAPLTAQLQVEDHPCVTFRVPVLGLREPDSDSSVVGRRSDRVDSQHGRIGETLCDFARNSDASMYCARGPGDATEVLHTLGKVLGYAPVVLVALRRAGVLQHPLRLGHSDGVADVAVVVAAVVANEALDLLGDPLLVILCSSVKVAVWMRDPWRVTLWELAQGLRLGGRGRGRELLLQ